MDIFCKECDEWVDTDPDEPNTCPDCQVYLDIGDAGEEAQYEVEDLDDEDRQDLDDEDLEDVYL